MAQRRPTHVEHEHVGGSALGLREHDQQHMAERPGVLVRVRQTHPKDRLGRDVAVGAAAPTVIPNTCTGWQGRSRVWMCFACVDVFRMKDEKRKCPWLDGGRLSALEHTYIRVQRNGFHLVAGVDRVL